MATQASTQHDPDAHPAGGRRRWIGLVVLAVALGMIVLDGTIVADTSHDVSR